MNSKTGKAPCITVVRKVNCALYLCLFLLLALFDSVGSTVEPTPRDFLQNAREYTASKDFENAEKALEKAVNLDPAFVNGWKELGKLHYWTGQYEQALKSFDTVLFLHPDDVSALSYKVRIYFVLKDNEKALELLQKLVDGKSDIDPHLLLNVYKASLDTRIQSEKRLNILRTYVRFESEKDRRLWGNILLDLLQDKPSDAFNNIALLRKYWSNDEALMKLLAHGYYHAGLFYMKEKQFDQAVTTLKEAASLQPTWYPAFRVLGWAYFATGNFNKAVSVWKKAIDFSGDKEQTLLMIVRAQLEGSYINDAERTLEALFRNNPNSLEGTIEKIRLLILKERIDEALHLIEEVKKHKPISLLGIRTSTSRLITMGGFEGALEIIENLPPEVRRDRIWRKVERRLYTSMGEDFLSQDNFEDSIRYLTVALDLEPDDLLSKKTLGWAYWRQGNEEAAVREWKEIDEMLSLKDDFEIIYNLIGFYTERNELMSITKIFKAQNPPVPVWQGFLKMAIIANERNNHGLAIILYDALLSDNPGLLASAPPVVQEELSELMLLDVKEKAGKGFLAEAEEGLQRYLWEWEGLFETFLGISTRNERQGNIEQADTYKRFATDTLNVHAKIAYQSNDPDAAAAYYSRSIHLNPAQPGIRAEYIGVLWRSLKQYGEAEKELATLLEMVEEQGKGNELEIAGTLTAMEKYSEAVPYWERLVSMFPDNLYYSMEYGRALYWSGNTEKGLEIVNTVLENAPDNPQALLFLAEHSMTVRDFNMARDLLERYIEIIPGNYNMRFQLATAAYESGHAHLAVENISLYLEKFPDDPDAQYFLAHIYMREGLYIKANDIYSTMIKENPANYQARIKRFENSLQDSTLMGQAVTDAQWAAEHYPHVGESSLNLANALASNTYFKRSIRTLNTYIKKNSHQDIPVLNYGTLSRHPYKRALTPDLFETHMQALKTHEYSALDSLKLLSYSLEHKKHNADSRPVIIAFNGALKETVDLATPILEKFGFAAILFISTEPVEIGSPSYLNPDELRALSRNPVWDVQLMGHSSSRTIPFSKNGTTGNYLTHLMWDRESKETETEQEYAKRIERDFNRSIRLYMQYTNKKPLAYNYYNGDAGQKYGSSFTKSNTILTELVNEKFELAFLNFLNGFATSHTDPRFITSFSVPYWWSSDEIVRHIKNRAPITRATLDLAKNLSWNSQFEEAAITFDKTAEMDANPISYNFGLGNSLLWEGNLLPPAREYFSKVSESEAVDRFESEKIEEAQDKVKYIDDRLSIGGDYFLEYWKDKDNGDYLGQRIQLSYSPVWPLRFFMNGSVFDVSKGNEDESGDRIGFGATYWPGRESSLRLEISRTNYNALSNSDIWGYDASLRFPVFGKGKLTVSGRKAPVLNLSSARKNISYHEQELYGSFRPNEWSEMQFDLSRQDYSDNNETYFVILHPLYIVKEVPNIKIGYYFRYGDSEFQTDDYYTPNKAWLHQMSISFKQFNSGNKKLFPEVRGKFGYGKDSVNDWRFAYSITGSLTYNVSSTFFIRGGAKYLRTSDYWFQSATLQLGLWI